MKMNWDKDTEFLVIVGYYDYDVSWAKKLKFPHVIYYKEKPEKEPFSAINKAKGETNTLKFIFDFYDNLPKNIIQVHQYDKKHYHTGSLVDILNAEDFLEKYNSSKTRGYWSFNNAILGSVKDQITRMKESGWWEGCMQKYFGDIENLGDFTLGKKGCSQFVVSRERILSLPKEFYLNAYNWLVKNSLTEEHTDYDPINLCRINTKNWQHSNSNCYTSRYMEWSWELIFTSYKPWEKTNYFLNDGKKILVLYGFEGYKRDVTFEYLNLLNKNNGKFPIGKLNDYFGDTVENSFKVLEIIINNNLYMKIDENWNIYPI